VYRITFVLGGDKAYRDKATKILLGALTLVDMAYLRSDPDALSPAKIAYEEEPVGHDDWVDASALQTYKKGDCEDLACYAAAWLQVRGGMQAWPQLSCENGHTHTLVEVNVPISRASRASRTSHTSPTSPASALIQRVDPSVLSGRIPPHLGDGHPCTGLGADGPEQRITVVTGLFNAGVKVGWRGSVNGSETVAHTALRILLNALFLIDRLYLKMHPETVGLHLSGVRYEEEPPGREDWQDIPTTLARRNGDCEDLATWRAAELTEQLHVNAYPTFIWKQRPTGANLYHIQTSFHDTATGRLITEDPSRDLGMNGS
jgi:hypothetical protein